MAKDYIRKRAIEEGRNSDDVALRKWMEYVVDYDTQDNYKTYTAHVGGFVYKEIAGKAYQLTRVVIKFYGRYIQFNHTCPIYTDAEHEMLWSWEDVKFVERKSEPIVITTYTYTYW